ncbi:hypothetical protein CEXT_55601 [Caerostris extrusa]|uniref:Uncharacterized protein n=1 Tax=Caerostris extrusa TaxID=172846 RepID=A0AAV4NBB1_CAEEX|nr:hypothetical protein CEXT_55601 [Caerostris extrusa]
MLHVFSAIHRREIPSEVSRTGNPSHSRIYSGLPKSGFNRSLGLRVFLSFSFFFSFPYREKKMKEWGWNQHEKVPAITNAASPRGLFVGLSL